MTSMDRIFSQRTAQAWAQGFQEGFMTALKDEKDIVIRTSIYKKLVARGFDIEIAAELTGVYVDIEPPKDKSYIYRDSEDEDSEED